MTTSSSPFDRRDIARPAFDRRTVRHQVARSRKLFHSRLSHWVEHELILKALPRPVRIYLLLVNLIGLGLFSLFLLLTPLSGPFTIAFLLVIAILAFLLEGRIWGLADYGFQGETLGYMAVLLAIVLVGSAAFPIIVCAVLVTRPITHPSQPVGRVFFNALTVGMGVFMGVKVYAVTSLWLGSSFVGSLLTLALTAMTMETISFLLILPARIMNGSFSTFSGRIIIKEIYEVERTAPIYAISVLFLSQAWFSDGVAGIMMVAGALLVPIMLNLAPSIDEAWSVIRAQEIVRQREMRRQDLLAQRIIGHSYVAFRDDLTGLINRFGFDDDIASLVDSGESQLLILVDVVGLKSVNDQHSHLAGDVLLRAVALGLLESLRVGDRIYRLGGDEFGALVPLISPDEVGTMMARISRAITKEAAHDPLLRGLETRARFGWASTSEEAADSLYSRADAVLTARHQHETALPDVR